MLGSLLERSDHFLDRVSTHYDIRPDSFASRCVDFGKSICSIVGSNSRFGGSSHNASSTANMSSGYPNSVVQPIRTAPIRDVSATCPTCHRKNTYRIAADIFDAACGNCRCITRYTLSVQEDMSSRKRPQKNSKRVHNSSGNIDPAPPFYHPSYTSSPPQIDGNTQSGGNGDIGVPDIGGGVGGGGGGSGAAVGNSSSGFDLKLDGECRIM